MHKSSFNDLQKLTRYIYHIQPKGIGNMKSLRKLLCKHPGPKSVSYLDKKSVMKELEAVPADKINQVEKG